MKIRFIKNFLFVAYGILLGCCVLWPSLQLLVILCGSCSWKNIHGEHRWHRILKYNYALHVQILFILQSLEYITRISQESLQYPASVRALQRIIFQTKDCKPTNLMKGGQAQHLVFLPILAAPELSKSHPKSGKLYFVTRSCAVM